MAIRVKNGRKNPYIVYWRNPTTHKLESKSFPTRAAAEKFNALILYQLQYEPENVQKPESMQGEDLPLTVERLFYLYLQDRNFTEANLARTLKSVKELMERYGQMSVDRVDKLLLIEMQRRCLATGNKGATVRRKMAVIKAMFNWAYRNGVIESLPLFPVAPTSVAARYMPPTPEEVSALYRAAPEHLKRVIILGFMFGMRVGPCEMLSLRWQHVDIGQGVIRVPNAKKGNTDAWREVPIKASLLPLIREWQEKDSAAGLEQFDFYFI
ncbi:tyrosine-type recombinase/integrase [Desulfovibrio sp. ZJ369]|uniref:tyrosine-type recombinase/integrase n=1 Tax=Desulfovibrio sp. ZJ369 TaxID=2709793 RepID=UPI0013ED38CA|nr:tyrosine-type recombinase/integrase [Desulfovibrio sp. ZJ369]